MEVALTLFIDEDELINMDAEKSVTDENMFDISWV
jgi:hypothetical protein